jgi:hypothetical protein
MFKIIQTILIVMLFLQVNLHLKKYQINNKIHY